MTGRRIFPRENYMVYDKDRNVSTCLKCNKQVKGKTSRTIKTHYRAYHKENVELLYSDYSVSMGMSRNEFVKCCVGLVTVQNLPFHVFDDDQFLKKLIAPYERTFGIKFNSITMAQQVSDTARKLKEHIYNSTKNKMICLKLDVVTSNDKNYSLAILTIQYINNFKIFTNTIGLLELDDDLGEMFIKSEVVQCLKEVQIEMGQIYSCTPGGISNSHASNILKASMLLKELQETWIIDNEGWDSTDESGEEDDDYKLSHVLAIVRCAEHSVQLAADDVFDAFKGNIDECRAVLTGLQIIDDTIDRYDDTTKWRSIYTMFKSIECLRNFIDNTENRLPEVDWTFVSDFVTAFKPLFNCENKFGSEQYILGDFYRDWLMCEIELEEIIARNGCAQLLLESMENRKARLLENEAFLAALYVDPRFNFVNTPFLNMAQKKTAVRHLLNTNNLIKLIGSSSENQILGGNFNPSTSLCSTNLYYKLERKMRRMAGVSLTDTLGRSMEQKLENLAFCEWIPFETNVLQYWKRFNNADPQLCKLVQVVLSAPSTQVSIDHAITALSAFTTMNSRLSKKSINDLLLVKLNHFLFDSLDI